MGMTVTKSIERRKRRKIKLIPKKQRRLSWSKDALTLFSQSEYIAACLSLPMKRYPKIVQDSYVGEALK
jgi:hypothetical protein